MGIILFIVAFLLSLVLMPLGFIWAMVEAFYKRGFKAGLNRLDKWFFDLALSLDQFGNVGCRELFNDSLIKPRSVNRFGNPDETVSSVLGKNKNNNTLTMTGFLLERLLHFLDENHSVNSIE